MEKGAAVALDQFSKEIASGAIAEGTINQTGYSLMGGRKVPDAILVMRKNVELHPTSWNAYDSLAEAYLKNGDKELAEKNSSPICTPYSRTWIGGIEEAGSELEPRIV